MHEETDVQKLLTQGRFAEAAKAALQRDGLVPMPTGHGAWLFVPTCPGVDAASNARKAQVRADVLGQFLGDAPARRQHAAGAGEQPIEQWMRVPWVTYASMWFELQRVHHGLHFPLNTQVERWQCMLQAVRGLAATLADHSGGRLPGSEAEDAYTLAKELLANRQYEATARAKKAGAPVLAHPAPLLPAAGGSSLGQDRDPRWAEVARRFAHPQSDAAITLCLLYFMHVLHSLLGIEQPPLDESYSSRGAPYVELVALLEQLPGQAPCPHAALAAAVARLLRRTALLCRSVREATLSIGDLPDRLPECFGPPAPHPSLPNLELVEAWAGPVAAPHLQLAHGLAERVFDHLLDPLRIRASRADLGLGTNQAPGWRAEATGMWFHRSRTQVVHAGRAAHARHALNLKHRADLAQLAIPRLSRLRAAGLVQGEWDEPGQARCALCHVQVATASAAPQRPAP